MRWWDWSGKERLLAIIKRLEDYSKYKFSEKEHDKLSLGAICCCVKKLIGEGQE